MIQFICLKKKENSSEKIIKIIFSGRLEERKGLNELKTLSNFIENTDGFELHIACHNETNTEFFTSNSKTHLHIGIAPDKMPDFYNSGDVMYFPTHYEGFSMATLEALSCGLPVIGTKWAISKELQDLPFCKLISEKETPQNILSLTKEFHESYKDKKNEIHDVISNRFGRNQYEEKLLALIKKSM